MEVGAKVEDTSDVDSASVICEKVACTGSNGEHPTLGCTDDSERVHIISRGPS